jgi:DNA-binding transcriptional LysR family regulator
MKSEWEDLKTVLYLHRGGSLAAAAELLGVNYTTVARRITRLEESLQVKLFNRLASGYTATEAGLEVARHAAGMEDKENTLYRALMSKRDNLQGPLTITAPQLLITSYLIPVFEIFCAAHPLVDLTVRASNELLNLSRQEADLAIRVSFNPGDTLVGQRLTKQQSASFAAPNLAQFIHDNPGKTIDWIGFDDWKGPPAASLEKYPNAHVRIRFDDMSAAIEAAKAGLGVINLPLYLGKAHSDLIQVPMLKPGKYPDIWVLSHKDMANTPGVCAFKQILIPYFNARQSEFYQA